MAQDSFWAQLLATVLGCLSGLLCMGTMVLMVLLATEWSPDVLGSIGSLMPLIVLLVLLSSGLAALLMAMLDRLHQAPFDAGPVQGIRDAALKHIPLPEHASSAVDTTRNQHATGA